MKYTFPLRLAWLGSLALLPFAAPHAAPDPLERPAISSALAQHVALTGVTRAGARLVAVGERGHILLSDDSGLSWRQARSPVSVTLTGVRFVGARLGWALGHGGVILHSADAGLSWTKQFDGRQLSGQGESGADKPFFDVYFSDEKSGMAIGAYGLIVVTGDGGKSWLPAGERLANPGKKHLYAIRAAGGKLFIAGEQGALYRSSDGGKHFEALESPYRGSFFDLLAQPDGTLLALGLRGNLFRSPDAGSSWSRIALGSKHSLTGAALLADGAVVLSDEAGALWRSTDQARSFIRSLAPGAFPYAGLAQAANGKVIAVGVRGVSQPLPIN